MLDAESLVQGLIGHVLKEERSMQGEVWGGGGLRALGFVMVGFEGLGPRVWG